MPLNEAWSQRVAAAFRLAWRGSVPTQGRLTLLTGGRSISESSAGAGPDRQRRDPAQARAPRALAALGQRAQPRHGRGEQLALRARSGRASLPMLVAVVVRNRPVRAMPIVIVVTGRSQERRVTSIAWSPTEKTRWSPSSCTRSPWQPEYQPSAVLKARRAARTVRESSAVWTPSMVAESRPRTGFARNVRASAAWPRGSA